MKLKSTKYLFTLLFFITLSVLIAQSQSVFAGTFTQTYVRLDRVQDSQTDVTGLVCAKTPAADNGTEADVQVVFPTGFTLGAFGTFTVATTNIPSGATAWPGIATATNVTSQTVTFPSTDLSTATLYCFRWTGAGAVTNPAAGNDKSGSITTRTSGPAAIDSGNYALSIITTDQISVSATVPLIYSMALSGTTMPLGTLSSSSVTSSTARTLTIATNAAAGWIAWLADANGTTTIGKLTSSLTSADINAPDSCANNTPVDLASNTGYVIDVDITTDSANGTGTVSQASNFGAEYAGSNSTSGGSPCTVFQPIAASNGTTDGDVLTMTARAKVTAYQAAATDYADTLTVVSAGRF